MDTKHIARRQREVIDLLLKQGVITAEMLEKAKEEAGRTGLSIDRALEKLGFAMIEDIVKIQADALGLPYMDLSDYVVDKEIIKLVPEKIAKKYNAVPLFKIGNALTVGMLDPQDIMAIDQIRRVSQLDFIEPVLVSEKGIQRIMDTCYGASKSVEDIIKSIDEGRLAEGVSSEIGGQMDEAPIIKLVNNIILQAVRERVSDIHVEPEEESVRVRCRVDGILRETILLPKKPQDGRIRLKIENKNLDIRVSTFPTVHGENVVMRLLDKSSLLLGLEDAGLSGRDLVSFQELIRHPNGIILVTGPTGSGKTTTLYSALTIINSIEKNIITIEDPVEYEIPLIRQTQINPLAGITFATD